MIALGLVFALLGSLWFAPHDQENGALRNDPAIQSVWQEEVTERISLPHSMPQWGVELEGLLPYDGPYIEDNSNDPVANVAGLILRNTGQTGLSLIVLAVEQGEKTTYFSITWLPPGEAVLALAMERGAYSPDPITGIRVLGIRRQDFSTAPVEVRITPDGWQVTNLSDTPLAGLHLRHKLYLQEQNLYFGGITQSVWLLLQPGESRLVLPDNYDPERSKIVAAIK